jgi:Arc/MetJ-type ribon-helix-helix transcriptional regulator
MPKLSEPRKKKTVYIIPELCQWIQEHIEKGEFWNFSHAIEVALRRLRDSEKEGKK